MKIVDPWKSDIINLIESNDNSEKLLGNLKLYILEHKDYFKTLMKGCDVTWLAKEIHRQIKTDRRNYND